MTANKQQKIIRFRKRMKKLRYFNLGFLYVVLPIYMFCTTGARRYGYRTPDFVTLSLMSSLLAWGALLWRTQILLSREENQDLFLVMEAYRSSMSKAKKAVWSNRVKTHLWQINQENLPVFDFLQKYQLMEYLSLEDRDLVLATLNALKWVGDENSLEKIQMLSEGDGRARNDSEIQQAALYTLSIAKTRLEEKERSDFLLRPSIAPVEPDSFLRPVSAPPQEEPATLLRAVNGASEEVQ